MRRSRSRVNARPRLSTPANVTVTHSTPGRDRGHGVHAQVEREVEDHQHQQRKHGARQHGFAAARLDQQVLPDQACAPGRRTASRRASCGQQLGQTRGASAAASGICSWTTRPRRKHAAAGAERSPVGQIVRRQHDGRGWSIDNVPQNVLNACRSSPVSGSSRSRIGGSWSSARAIVTRCCWPRDKRPTRSSARCASPTRASSRPRASRVGDAVQLARRSAGSRAARQLVVQIGRYG